MENPIHSIVESPIVAFGAMYPDNHMHIYDHLFGMCCFFPCFRSDANEKPSKISFKCLDRQQKCVWRSMHLFYCLYSYIHKYIDRTSYGTDDRSAEQCYDVWPLKSSSQKRIVPQERRKQTWNKIRTCSKRAGNSEEFSCWSVCHFNRRPIWVIHH